MICYLHHVPGRIRIKSNYVKGPSTRSQALEQKLKSSLGVRVVTTNALTGSLLIHYDKDATDAGVIMDLVSKQTGIDFSAAVHPDQYVDETLEKTGRMLGNKIGKAALGLVIGQLLDGSPLALLAAVI